MFYERYLEMCQKKRLSPSAAAELAGFNRGTVSSWKKKYEAGSDVSPETDVIEKICAFFGCDEAWLRGIESKKEAPTPEGGRYVSNEDYVLLERFRAADNATREVILRLLEYR